MSLLCSMSGQLALCEVCGDSLNRFGRCETCTNGIQFPEGKENAEPRQESGKMAGEDAEGR